MISLFQPFVFVWQSEYYSSTSQPTFSVPLHLHSHSTLMTTNARAVHVCDYLCCFVCCVHTNVDVALARGEGWGKHQPFLPEQTVPFRNPLKAWNLLASEGLQVLTLVGQGRSEGFCLPDPFPQSNPVWLSLPGEMDSQPEQLRPEISETHGPLHRDMVKRLHHC